MDKTKRTWLVLIVLVLCGIGVAILNFPAIDPGFQDGNPLPPKLRIGVLPDEAPERLHQRYAPLLAHLSESLQVNSELVVPESYDELLELFDARTVDLAYFGGFTYVRARQQSGAVPVVMRLIDTRFTSYFLVPGDSGEKTLQDLRGKTFSFGSRLSTSGHLMPRFFLGQQGIVPETFFAAVEYSGAHDRTAYRVRDGQTDGGAANAATIRSMLADGRLDSGDVRILWETPPYADYVWALQPGFSASAQERLRDAFLQLTPEVDAHAAILEGLEAKGFLPADPEFFGDLAKIAAEIDPLLTADPVQ